MVTLYTEQSKNVTKTWLLMAIFLGIVIGIGYFLTNYYRNPSILYIAIIFALVMNLVSYWYSDKIVTKLAGAHEADRAQYFDFFTTVENLSTVPHLALLLLRQAW